MGKAGDRGKILELAGTPADKITLGIIVEPLISNPQPLHAGLAKLELFLVIGIDHAGRDGFFSGIDDLDDLPKPLRPSGEASQQVGFGVRHPPVLTVTVALVPIGIDAGLAGAAVVKEQRLLAGLGPGHDRLPLAGVEPFLGDVLYNPLARVNALEVFDLLEMNDIALVVDLLDLQNDNVHRLLDDVAEAHGNLDIPR